MKDFVKNLKLSLAHDEELRRMVADRGVEPGQISDGYHTFDELYYYRVLYNAGMFNLLNHVNVPVIKSKCHNGGEKCFDGSWFIVQASLPTGQISNHYKLEHWNLFKIPELPEAWEWDGHDSIEASARLENYILNYMNENISEEFKKSITNQCNDDVFFIKTENNKIILCSQIVSFERLEVSGDSPEMTRLYTTGNIIYDISMSIDRVKQKLLNYFKAITMPSA